MRRRRVQPDASLVVGYVRVSTDDQQLGPEAQREALRRWCAGQGRQLVDVCEDCTSGATPALARPGMQQALLTLRRHNAGVLLVTRRDRLARDLLVITELEALLLREGVRILSTDNVGAGDGSSDALLRRFFDLFAEHERTQIRERTRAALGVRRRRGERYSGHPPFGFAFDGDRLVACPMEQAALERARALHMAGASQAQICHRLTVEGHAPRGGRWHRTTVARMLQPADE